MRGSSTRPTRCAPKIFPADLQWAGRRPPGRCGQGQAGRYRSAGAKVLKPTVNNKQPPITLRAATLEDCRRLWVWRNEPDTRAASFESEIIPYEEHERWFSNSFSQLDTQIFIVVNAQGHEVGYVRFKVTGNCAEVSTSIDSNERAKGYGSAAVRAGAELLLSAGRVQRIVALVKCWNTASVRTFERAGFVRNGTKKVAGSRVWEMVYAR